MTRMTGPDCAVMCSLITTYYTRIIISGLVRVALIDSNPELLDIRSGLLTLCRRTLSGERHALVSVSQTWSLGTNSMAFDSVIVTPSRKVGWTREARE